MCRTIGILDGYRARSGRFPTTTEGLDVLCPHAPSKTPLGVWVPTDSLLTDPWGVRYLYRCPGTHNPHSYDLWSRGPDRVDGTGDDITNWQRE